MVTELQMSRSARFSPPTRGRPPALCLLALLVVTAMLLGEGLLGGPGSAAYADDVGAEKVSETARKKAISGLGKSLGKLARDPRLERKMDEVAKILDSLEALGGPEAGVAALKGVGITDEATRDRLFALIEMVQDKSTLKPLLALLENKRFRRDADLKRRVAHALAVLADPKAIEPLSDLIRYDQDAEVVAEAADALAVFAGAAIEKKRIGVRRMVDLYESTYNLMKSVRVEDKLQVKNAARRWKAYARSIRGSIWDGVLARPPRRRSSWRSSWGRPWQRHSKG